MLPARTFTRTALPRAAARSTTRNVQRGGRRLQSTTPNSSSAGANSGGSPYVAGAVGGLVAGGALYGAYLMSPSGRMARSINKTTKEAQQKYQEAATKFQQSTPEPDQAVQYIKDLCYSYVAWIPGGRQ